MNWQEFHSLVQRAVAASSVDTYDEDGNRLKEPGPSLSDELLTEIERAGYRLVRD